MSTPFFKNFLFFLVAFFFFLFSEWLDVMDYELVIKPKKGAGRRKEGEYVIERVTDGE